MNDTVKQGLNFHLKVNFDTDLNNVEEIEFAFSSRKGTTPQKLETCPGNVTRVEGENAVLVPFSQADTYRFKGKFFMDTRLTYAGTGDQPQTPILELEMTDTLFERK